MDWENAKKLFPQGVVVTPENTMVTIDELHRKKINVISSLLSYNARNMIHKQEEWAWGKDGEFGIATLYDALSISSMSEGISPLNVYGATMLHDYVMLNDINLNDEEQQSII